MGAIQRRTKTIGVAAVAAGLVLSMQLLGCGSDKGPTAPGAAYTVPPASSGQGLFALAVQPSGTLNGAPGGPGVPSLADHGMPGRTPLSALYITFDSIRVYPACEDSMDEHEGGDGGDDSTMTAFGARGLAFLADDDDTLGGDESDSCGYVEVLTSPVTLNMAGLDTTLTQLLGTLDLDMGDYSHLSLHLADAWVVTEAGDSVQASLPGMGNNWLKVLFPFTVSAGQVTEIVIHFDLARSVVEAPPGSMRFMIKPVIHGRWGPHDWEHHGDDHGGMPDSTGDDDGHGGMGDGGMGGGNGQGNGHGGGNR